MLEVCYGECTAGTKPSGNTSLIQTKTNMPPRTKRTKPALPRIIEP